MNPSLPINQIIEGDCLRELPKLPEKSVDVLYTDFPYGMNKDFGNESDGLKESKRLIEQSLKESFRVLRWDCPAIFWFHPARIDLLLEAMKKERFTFRRLLWMYKSNDIAYPWQGWMCKSEVIIIASKGELKLPKPESYDNDCYVFAHNGGDGDFFHPSVKPLIVTEKLILKVSSPNDIILDFFSGSGTTLVACQKLNRRFIGIEINPQYCEIARKRIQPWLEQRRLA